MQSCIQIDAGIVAVSRHIDIKDPMTDKRSRTVVFICHCLLNQNAKVEPLANHRGVFEPLVRQLMNAGVGIVQLPCPELEVHGVARPLGTDTVDQYDTSAYRKACQNIADQAVRSMQAYVHEGYRVACVLGVEGSPSCSVEQKPVLQQGKRVTVKGSGLFIEALKQVMEEVSMGVPIMGVPECDDAGDIVAALQQVERVLCEEKAVD